MAKGFSVFVNIGGKVLGSLGAAVRQTQNQISKLNNMSVGGGVRSASAYLQDARTRIAVAQKLNQMKLEAARGNLLEATAAAWAFGRAIEAPTKAAGNFEAMLIDIGQKADMTRGQMTGLGDDIMKMSRDLGVSSMKIGEGIDNLIGKGLSSKDALAIIPDISKTAAAYRASVDDVASAGHAVMSNLKVPASDFRKSLDIMAQAGKDGAFELRDMAGEFPALTAAAQALEMRGVRAVSQLSAALQIARRGAGTSSEAANNVANLMAKIVSPETVKKFKKHGIDIRKELRKTQKEGGDVFEMIAKQTMKATKGDLSKLGDIFQDMQVANALKPLIQNLRDYAEIRDRAARADGVVQKDWLERVDSYNSKLASLSASMERVGINVGNALLPSLKDLMGWLEPVTQKFADWARENPKLVSSAVAATSALVGLRLAGTGLRWLGLIGKGSLLSLAGGLLRLASVATPGLAGNLATTAAGMDKLSTSANRLEASGRTLKRGVGLWRTGLLALNALDVAVNMPSTIEESNASAAAWKENEKKVGSWWQANAPKWLQTATNTGEKQWDGGAWLKSIFSGATKVPAGPIKDPFASPAYDEAKRFADYQKAAEQAGAGAKEALNITAQPKIDTGSIDAAGAKVEWLKGLIASINAAGIKVSTPSLPSPMPSPPPGKAIGGPVRNGTTYLVGERGPELFTPGLSGHIHTNQALRHLQRAGSLSGGGAGSGYASPTAVAQVSGKPAQRVPASVTMSPSFTIQGGDPQQTALVVRREMERLIARMEAEQRSLLSD